MTDPNELDDVIERLNCVLSQTTLPSKAKPTAERLIARLSSPVRVTLMGPRKAGKTTLRNVLAGARVVPEEILLPTTELRFAETAKITATLADGSRKELAGLDFAGLQRLAPIFADICAPLPSLKNIRLLEVVTGDAPKDVIAAAKWAARRTDIAIWVTPNFTPQEQALWAKVPEEMKDHGFLVLSQVDKLPTAARGQYMARLKDIAAREFHSFFPAATLQGLGAVESKSAKESKIFKDSGCEALRTALLHHVDLGTQADIDGALLFLNRFETASATARMSVTPPISEEIVSQQDDDRAGDVTEIAEAPGFLQVEEIFSQAQSMDHGSQQDAQHSALACLRSSARTMLEDLTNVGSKAPEIVLDRCFQTIEDLASTLSDVGQLFEPVMEASDVIVLLQLEKSESAAEDAIITLIQLRREIETVLAA